MSVYTLQEELLRLIVPKEIADNFELKKIVEKTTTITLYFEEKTNLIPDILKDKDIVLDGFLNKIEIQTFPLKDKTVYLCIRRRRWKEKNNSEATHFNTYDLYVEGMKTTKEFGVFLKEEFRLHPDEYNEFWKGTTN